ncbi:MAG: mannose-1-phosphate guanylyltransferase [Silvanigrellales bacterium]|jgi:mannose-1-phosphate guanylyltransferase|nr:mannose-1-phosphate guanylyltransferase [Silvanigrellales bacterium]
MTTSAPHSTLPLASGFDRVYSIILSGGSGTRLWPLSRKARPKQFLTLGGAEESLLQASLQRVERVSPPERRWIVTARGQEDLCREQAGERVSRLLVEPKARNTAAAIAWAAWELLAVDEESYMAVLSSDHSIQNVRSFEQTIADAVKLAKRGLFVTVGIQPTSPATGFGYIEYGLPLDAEGKILSPTRLNETPQDAVGYSVRSFREKPNAAAAEQFLRTGKYLWNAGIFVWKTRTFWDAFSHIQPDMARAIETARPDTLEATYAALESVPIDVAFIEQTSHVACVPARFDWNDVGSWHAVRECFSQDAQGNSVSGDVFLQDTRGCVVHSTGPLVATIGLENICVVATEDAILVMPLDRSQDVKRVITHLEQQGRRNLL